MRYIDYKDTPGKQKITYSKTLKEEKPLISIITPFYNADDNVFFTMNSVLSQTFPFFEWIIINDGSTNKESLNILKKLEKEDKRIKVYTKENGGPSQARDFGVEKTSNSSKYLYFIDSDDIIDTTMLEILYWSLETHKDASFAYTTCINFQDEESVSEPFFTLEHEMKDNNIWIASMVKKEDFLSVGGFGIKEKKMYEDWGLWLKLLAKEKKPLKINTPIFWYRKSNTGELSRAKENNEKAMEYIDSIRKTITKDVKAYQFPNKGEISPSINENIDFIVPYYKKEKKSILFFIPWMQLGGADLFNLNLIENLKKDYEIIIITTRVSENEIRDNFRKHCNKIYELASFLERKDYYKFVKYITEANNIDIVINSNSAEGYGLFPMLKENFPNIKIIDYIHAVELNDGKGGFGKYSQIFDNYIDYTYACNNFTKNQLIEKFNKTRVKTIYIGTDTDKYDPEKFDKNKLKQKYKIDEAKLIISFVARLSDEKRPMLFIKIAQELLKKRNDLEFIIAGDGPLLNKIKFNIQKKGLKDKIHLVGMVKSEDIYKISDLTINCSSLEGLALTSYESLSMGVPVISTSVGGQTELIDDTVGKIVKYDKNRNPKEELIDYVESVENVLANLNDIKNNCRKRILDNFTTELMHKKFRKEINDLLEKENTNIKSDSKTIFELVLDIEYKLHNWLTSEYYFKNFGVNIDDNYEETFNNEISKKRKIILKLKKISTKYNIKEEAQIIISLLRTIKAFILEGIIISSIKYIKNIFKYLYYTIKFFIKSLIAIPKIIIKLVKK